MAARLEKGGARVSKGDAVVEVRLKGHGRRVSAEEAASGTDVEGAYVRAHVSAGPVRQ